MTFDGLGRVGVWRGYAQVSAADAGAYEEAGYGAVWLGGSPPADLARVDELLAATESLTVATSIVNIWQSPAKEVAESFHRLEAGHPGRFLLGVGAGHREFDGVYRKPYDALVDYLDELDAQGVPRERRALAALGPKVLRLARDRSAGALPYLVSPEHSRKAREIVGAGTLLATEQKVVLDSDPERARAVGRQAVTPYLGLTNYVNNLRRLGYSDADVATPGSDGLVDALAVHGDARRVAQQVAAHLDAGADHVAVQALGGGHLETLRALAPHLVG